MPNRFNQQNGITTRQDFLNSPRTTPMTLLVLQPLNGTFEKKQISVPCFPEVHKIGRQTNQRTVPAAVNGYFDSKVLSRQHAEIWADRSNRVWIRDVKSSNGTFVNGFRLSAENKESDPHELREQDTLELGIDIISEDQKSVLHHKVAAKVEMAGPYADSPVIDLMQFDPNTGLPLAGDFANQHMAQIRGVVPSPHLPGTRLGSGVAINMLGSNRPMNKWMGPITVEQIAQRLAKELKEAKRQSRNLQRTDAQLKNRLTRNNDPNGSRGQGDQATQAELDRKPETQQMTSAILTSEKSPKHKSGDVFFEAQGEAAEEGLGQNPKSLMRAETERPNGLHKSSGSDSSDGQMSSLLEALQSAKMEIRVQGDRMQGLESALKQERAARERAERRARALAGFRAQPLDSTKDSSAGNGTLSGTTQFGGDVSDLDDLDDLDGQEMSDRDRKSPTNSTLSSHSSLETLREAGSVFADAESEADDQSIISDPSFAAHSGQSRLDLLLAEMTDLKSQADQYKRRAEEAESAQRRFAAIVEDFRQSHADGRGKFSSAGNASDRSRNTPLTNGMHREKAELMRQERSPGLSNSMAAASLSLPSSESMRERPDGRVDVSSTVQLQQELEKTLSSLLSQKHNKLDASIRDRGLQSAPYISMLGVVLIGVGIMTWLNGRPPLSSNDT